ncbi:hypothetical protein AAON49_05425 [Pseudotenacibaculum sp. MALMAid0570]|uniref:hypothetical protein n=1 Tax=Pseudotenacibaculum sp. MALMAid0570 TaxID=3143938 RepID=UPI0032DEE397
MSFGGAVGAMITSLKNNKRDRKSALKKLKDSGVEYSDKTELHFENEASPMELKKIREKVKEENRKIIIRNIIIMTVIMLIAIYFIGFAKF